MTEDDEFVFPPLLECEELVDDPKEWFYRQVNPGWISEDGIVDPEAFQTTSADNRMLSGVRNSKQTAQGAYEESKRDFPDRPTDGSWGLTVEQAQKAKGRVVDDSKCPPPAGHERWPTGHAYLDQRIGTKLTRKRLRRDLARFATNNRRQYPLPATAGGWKPSNSDET